MNGKVSLIAAHAFAVCFLSHAWPRGCWYRLSASAYRAQSGGQPQPPPPPAQTPPAQKPQEGGLSIAVEVPVVTMDVVATTSHGDILTGLKRENFRLSEDGVSTNRDQLRSDRRSHHYGYCDGIQRPLLQPVFVSGEVLDRRVVPEFKARRTTWRW